MEGKDFANSRWATQRIRRLSFRRSRKRPTVDYPIHQDRMRQHHTHDQSKKSKRCFLPIARASSNDNPASVRMCGRRKNSGVSRIYFQQAREARAMVAYLLVSQFTTRF